MKTKHIEYIHDNELLEGFIVYDETHTQKRPAVIVVHDWSGRNEFACNKAKLLAEMGYVGFALDMYGKNKIGNTNEEKTKLMTPLVQDRKFLRGRLFAALETLKKNEFVDHNRIAAIGFCFGGLCVLDLARSGADVKGVVSFHGLLSTPENLPNETIKAKVLALHGFDDPMGTPDLVLAFQQEMTKAKADWQMHIYGNTVHAFMNPLANDPALGLVYNPVVEQRAWTAMKDFLNEIFKS